jgi:hypothetical protein
MDIEDQIRDAVRVDRPEPSTQFSRRVMAGLPDRPGSTRRAFPTFPRLLTFAAVALVVIVAIGAIGLPLMFSKPIAAGPSVSPSASVLETASEPAPTPSPTPTQAAQNSVPTVGPVASHAPSPQFTPTGSPKYRYENATVLKDGRVLFVGGYDDAIQAFVSGTALYDPATGKFTPTGSLSAPRVAATATRLLDGRVLIVGGMNSEGTTLSTAEIYDPAGGKFSATGSMATPRQFHTATLLKDGRVLVTGGFGDTADATAQSAQIMTMAYRPHTGTRTPRDAMTLDTGMRKSAEIYDPNTGKFTSAGSMTEARTNATAALLQDGRVLIFGNIGGADGGALATDTTAELYDPATGKFSPTGSLGFVRTNAQATVLNDGRVLVTDGSNDGKSAEIYDPKTGKFSGTGSLNTPRGGFGVTKLSDGRVLISGGSLVAGGNATSSAEMYDPTTGKFNPAGWMTAARGRPAAVLLNNGRVLIADGKHIGPEGWVGIPSAEIFTP